MGLIMYEISKEITTKTCTGCKYKSIFGDVVICENDFEGGNPTLEGCEGFKPYKERQI